MPGVMKPAPPSDSMQVFDRSLVRLHRDRAAAGLAGFDFLLREVGGRLADRLSLIRRTFPRVLDLGCHAGHMAESLLADPLRRQAGIETLIQADLSPNMAACAAARSSADGRPITLAADEEALPFAAGSLDLVVSCLSLHWVNDLPGALLQIRQALRPDGLFLAALLGGDTLHELRRCLMEAEIELTGGLSPRVSPMADLRDVAGLLQRAGFALPVADSDTLTVSYPDPLKLIRDLRGMGETNAVLARLHRPSRRDLFALAMQRYAELFTEADGTVPATFQVLYLAGWTPDPGAQQQPSRRGSATARLADALGSTEISLTPAPGLR
jgi:NADH dehydrogenase [ubiquinone] 1 alpha subcomplex assembly factor 5